jgi:very-short-patch-repair endonuclease
LFCRKVYTKKGTGTKNGTKYCSQDCAHRDIFSRKKSEEHRRKIAEAQKHIRVAGDFLCERCGKTFDSNTGLRAHKAHCGHIKADVICDRCHKVFRGNAALVLHQSDCLDGTWKKNRITAIRKANVTRIQRSSGTDIEVLMENAFNEAGIELKKQHRIAEDSWHCYDFYLPKFNLLVEADGDFWHGRKDQVEKPWHDKQRAWDKMVVEYASRRGFRVIRFWGSDITKDARRCVKEAIAYGQGCQRGADWCSRCL